MLALLSFHDRNLTLINLFDSNTVSKVVVYYILSSLPDLLRLSTFLPGCQRYYSKLDQPAVDLTREKPRNDQTFKFHNNKNCTLSASYFYDYEGFQSSWQHVADDFFALEKNGTTFSVKVSF